MADSTYRTVTPYLVADDADALMKFMTAAFGAVEKRSDRRPDGTVAWQGTDLTPEQARQMQQTYEGTPSNYTLHTEPAAPGQPKGFLSHVYQHTPDLIGWTRYAERHLTDPV